MKTKTTDTQERWEKRFSAAVERLRARLARDKRAHDERVASALRLLLQDRDAALAAFEEEHRQANDKRAETRKEERR